jgi:leader peptidase (prepilin peptidase)/N-methyltransferase
MYVLTTHSRPALTAGGLVVVTCAVSGLVGTIRHDPLGLAIAASLGVAAAAAAVDLRSGRLPDRIVALSAAPAVVAIAAAVIGGDGAGTVPAVLAGIVLFAGPLLAVHLVAPAAMGFGDVKQAAVLGAVLGLVDPRSTLVALCIATAGTAAVGLAARRPVMPLGPGLVAGAAGAFAVVELGGVVQPWR